MSDIMNSQDPELSADTPNSTEFMLPGAGPWDQVLAELRVWREERRQGSIQTRVITRVLTGQTDANGYLTVALPLCPQGFRDRVIGVIIGGQTMQAASPGNGTLFMAGSIPVGDIAIPTALVRDFASTLPNVGLYDDKKMIVQNGALIGVQIYDATAAAAQYVIVITYYREPTSGIGTTKLLD